MNDLDLIKLVDAINEILGNQPGCRECCGNTISKEELIKALEVMEVKS